MTTINKRENPFHEHDRAHTQLEQLQTDYETLQYEVKDMQIENKVRDEQIKKLQYDVAELLLDRRMLMDCVGLLMRIQNIKDDRARAKVVKKEDV